MSSENQIHETESNTTIPTAEDLDYPENEVTVSIDVRNGDQSVVMEHEGAFIRVDESAIMSLQDCA